MEQHEAHKVTNNSLHRECFPLFAVKFTVFQNSLNYFVSIMTCENLCSRLKDINRKDIKLLITLHPSDQNCVCLPRHICVCLPCHICVCLPCHICVCLPCHIPVCMSHFHACYIPVCIDHITYLY